MGTMTMKDLNSKFLSLLRYVPYLVDEKPKVQRFLRCLPYHIKDRIEYDNPKTLEEAMRKANFCYEKTGERRGWPIGRPKRIIIIMIKKRKNLCPIGILKIIRP